MKAKILSQISELDIFRHYIPGFTPEHVRGEGQQGKNFSSVFAQDSNPSMNVYRSGGKLLYKCHATGKQGDAWQLVAELHGLDCKVDFKKVCEQLAVDMKLETEDAKPASYVTDTWKAEYYEDFTAPAMVFWQGRGVSRMALDAYGVRQMKRLTVKFAKGLKYEYAEMGLMAFEFTAGGRKKAYIPAQEGHPEKRIYKTQKSEDIFGFEQAKPKRGKHKYLLICEGESDCLAAASAGIPAVSFQSATTKPTRRMVRELRQYATRLLLCYDNDKAGRSAAEWFEREFGVLVVSLPEGYKDVSEFAGDRSAGELTGLLHAAIEEDKENNPQPIWEYDGCYWVATAKGRVAVSNFTMEVESQIVGSTSSKRLMRFRHKRGYETGLLAIEGGIFDSSERLREYLNSLRGNYVWKGTVVDLMNIRETVFDLCDYCAEVEAVGWHPAKRVFIMADAVVEAGGVVHEYNGEGMVPALELYNPVADPANADNPDHAYRRKFALRLSGPKMTARQWLATLGQFYGKANAAIGFSFMLATVYSDAIFERTAAMPSLFLAGQKGSGKTSFARLLMSLFTSDMEEVNLNETTSLGFIRRMGETQNIAVFLDEFHNALKEDKQQALKGLYNRQGKTRANYRGDGSTQGRVLSTAIIAGQEAPYRNEALFSRSIFLFFNTLALGPRELAAFRSAEREMLHGGGHVLLDILKHRASVEKGFDAAYLECAKFLSAEAPKAVTRLVDSFSMVLAAVVLAVRDGLLDAKAEAYFKQVFADAIRAQAEAEGKIDEVSAFLEHVATMCLSEGQHSLKLGSDVVVNIQQEEILLRSSVFPAHARFYIATFQRQFVDATSLKGYFGSKAYYKGYERRSIDGVQQRYYVFNFAAFGAELIDAYQPLLDLATKAILAAPSAPY